MPFSRRVHCPAEEKLIMVCGRSVFGASLCIAAFACQAQPYVFTPIADVTALPGFTAVALNNAGTMAIGVSQGTSQRIDSWSRSGSHSTLVDTSGELASFTTLQPLPFNNSGAVAFRGTLDNGTEGFFTYSSGVLRTVADTTGQFSAFGAPSSLIALNDVGSVAFYARLRSGGAGVFLNSGATTATVASTSGGVYSDFNPLAVALNNRGDVVMVANQAAGGQALLLSAAGGVVTSIIDTSGPLSSFGNILQINNNGSIAFTANLDAGGTGVFLWEGGLLTPVMTALPGNTVSPVSINDLGTISIVMSLSAQRHVVYLYKKSEGVTRLLGAGDSFLGSTIVGTPAPDRGVFTSVNSINDLDELAMEVLLADGRKFLALASPVPDLSTMSSLTVGLMVVLLLIKGRQLPDVLV
jgi:hypothetical protein